MAAENGFLIGGKVYEVPTLDSLTLDESELMFEQCGLAQEDFVQDAGETDDEHQERVRKLMRHPAFMGSLAQIAYQRGNPDVKPSRVRELLGATNRMELFSTLAAPEEEPDEIPLASTSGPGGASPNDSHGSRSSTGGSSGSGGSGSTNGSDAPDADRATTGTGRLGMSSTSVPTRSAVSGFPI